MRKRQDDHTIWYRVIDLCGDSYFSISLPNTYDLADQDDQWVIAQWCAEDYHNNHDGWEAAWPLTLALHSAENGPEVARLRVEREVIPQFSASHVTEPKA